MKANSKRNIEHPKVNAMAAGAHEAVDWAADATNSATDRLTGGGREMMAMEERWRTRGRAYVQKNPATSIGIAVVGGFLLSLVLRSR